MDRKTKSHLNGNAFSGSPLSGSPKVQKVHSSSEFQNLETYDLTNPDYKIHDLLPTLELINQRFSQLFRHAISSIFRCNIDVQFDRVDSLQVGDYLANESTPDLKHIYKSTTLRCSGFMALESPMLFSLVDIFFSGTGETLSPQRQELTTAEIRILNRVLKASADKQTEAWSSILSFKIKLAETYNSPISTLFRSDTEIILLSQFTLQLGNNTSSFHLVMPYQALEPVREKLQAFKVAEQDPQWQRNMLQGLMQAPLDLSARLCEVDVSLRDVMRLKPGQIIQVDIPPSVTVKVAGVPTFKASVCSVQSSLAMKITKKLHTEDADRSSDFYQSEKPEEKEVYE
ncbi:FliM/FliN family flagellar motor switch protein [uncultured Endozoicomonas sp.]|uniref:flagellar motor switch protein FliM n=1 Tax=uncultured Endozoicomonas sp. TaxID=432652 RepID=UPI00261B04C6|nr:FliM/FliN family flagellar motor switch protein [uncultured Endozoicomonas sp.]